MENLIKKLSKEAPIEYSRGNFYRIDLSGEVVGFPVEVDDRNNYSLEVDRIQKYLGSVDYKDDEEKILDVPRKLLRREEDRNFVIYWLPLSKKTYEYYKKRLCQMLLIKKEEEN